MWNIIQAIVWHMWWFLHFGAGNKVNNIDVVYTPWYNLKKTPSMDVGQVGFHNPKLVRAHQLFFCSLFLQQDYVHMLLYVPWQTLYALYGCGSKCVIHASDRVPYRRTSILIAYMTLKNVLTVTLQAIWIGLNFRITKFS